MRLSLIAVAALLVTAAPGAALAEEGQMWKTLRNAGKSPAQVRAEELEEEQRILEEQQSLRSQKALPKPKRAVMETPESVSQKFGDRSMDLPDPWSDHPGMKVVADCYGQVQERQTALIREILIKRHVSQGMNQMQAQQVVEKSMQTNLYAAVESMTDAERQSMTQEMAAFSEQVGKECDKKFKQGTP